MADAKPGSLPSDIFISYRRSDSESFAALLSMSLRVKGYTVFFDQHSLGAGNFHKNIEQAIDGCSDFIVILSRDALSRRIAQPDDVMHREIAHAFEAGKRIIGIRLEGCPDWPDYLPEDIQQLRNEQCIGGNMEYYQSMVDKLTSGKFLLSTPHIISDKEAASDGAKDALASLEEIRSMPAIERQGMMRIVMQLQRDFNDTPGNLHLYHYLDVFDRNRGIRETPPYDGDVPTDYANYLEFFETVYMLVATGTVSLSVIDPLFRFRFFAACNNPEIQKSELFAFGEGYSSVLNLNTLWREYICTTFAPLGKVNSLDDYIPLYEHDLHRRYRSYAFISDMSVPRHLDLIDRRFRKLPLEMRRLGPDDLDRSLELQGTIAAAIPHNEGSRVFAALTREEMETSLGKDICVGFFQEDELVAQANIIPNPTPEQDLLAHVRDKVDESVTSAAVIDLVMVKSDCRGFGLQLCMIDIAKFVARKHNVTTLLASVSPCNLHSSSNFIMSGFHAIKTGVELYGSRRDVYICTLEE